MTDLFDVIITVIFNTNWKSQIESMWGGWLTQLCQVCNKLNFVLYIVQYNRTHLASQDP